MKRLLAAVLSVMLLVSLMPSAAAEAEKVYYLFGYINGSNYACEEDYENMGEYRFDENGSLVARFDSVSYVAVKEENNADWYMTDGWQGETDCVQLYSTSVTGANSDKLMVPAGVNVRFNLMKDFDGGLILSYTVLSDDNTLNLPLDFESAVDQYLNSAGLSGMMSDDREVKTVVKDNKQVTMYRDLDIFEMNDSLAVFGLNDCMATVSEEVIDGYRFTNPSFFGHSSNATGLCVFHNGVVMSIKDAVESKIITASELARIIPFSKRVEGSADFYDAVRAYGQSMSIDLNSGEPGSYGLNVVKGDRVGTTFCSISAAIPASETIELGGYRFKNEGISGFGDFDIGLCVYSDGTIYKISDAVAKGITTYDESAQVYGAERILPTETETVTEPTETETVTETESGHVPFGDLIPEGDYFLGNLGDSSILCYHRETAPPWMVQYSVQYGRYIFTDYVGEGESGHGFYVMNEGRKLMLNEAIDQKLTDIDEIVEVIKNQTAVPEKLYESIISIAGTEKLLKERYNIDFNLEFVGTLYADCHLFYSYSIEEQYCEWEWDYTFDNYTIHIGAGHTGDYVPEDTGLYVLIRGKVFNIGEAFKIIPTGEIGFRDLIDLINTKQLPYSFTIERRKPGTPATTEPVKESETVIDNEETLPYIEPPKETTTEPVTESVTESGTIVETEPLDSPEAKITQELKEKIKAGERELSVWIFLRNVINVSDVEKYVREKYGFEVLNNDNVDEYLKLYREEVARRNKENVDKFLSEKGDLIEKIYHSSSFLIADVKAENVLKIAASELVTEVSYYDKSVILESEVIEPVTDPDNTPEIPKSDSVVKKSKKTNTLSVKTTTVSVKAKTLNKKNCSKQALKITGNKGKVSAEITKITLNNKKVPKKTSKLFKLSSKGKLTLKKGINKGKYKLTVKISAKGNSKYKKKTVTKTVTVKVN